MNKNAWIILALGVVLIGGLYAYSKKAPESYTNNPNATTTVGTTTEPGNINATTTGSAIHPYGRIDVNLNQKLNYSGGQLQIVSVDEDSRCATGVQCIWAGTVKTTLEYSQNGVAKKGTLELNKSITRGNEKITLVGVRPSPLPGKSISDKDYIFTLEVIKVSDQTNVSSGGTVGTAGCFVGGCSGQICSDQKDVVSTCEFRESYACYKTAKCERQQNGQCGWTQTPELKACLANAG